MANNSNNASDYLNPASQVMIQQIEQANKNAERSYWWMKGVDCDEAQRLGVNDMVQSVLDLLQKVDYESVGQFTGVYDCNGKEVYEGDIVLARSEGECRMCQVVFSERTCSFFLYNNSGPWYISADNTMKDTLLEIIGNIHDNPDIIK